MRDHARERRLRFVFADAVVWLGLSADATFGAIARMLGRISERFGDPAAISVTLGPASRATRVGEFTP